MWRWGWFALLSSWVAYNRQSLYMAKHNGMDAIAYNAANTNNRYWKLVMFLRERGSRVKAVMGGIY